MSAGDIGIDLGTASVLVYVKGKGIVLCEPSVVAVDKSTGKILAIGEDAQKMLGRTPGNITAIRPMRDGAIADYAVTEAMLKYFISKAYPQNPFSPKPRIVICVPSGITPVEKRAVIEAAGGAGAKERHIYIVEEPMAAALGADLKIDEPAGNMIVDIGGGVRTPDIDADDDDNEHQDRERNAYSQPLAIAHINAQLRGHISH